jgi:hypothetical protein
MDPPISGANRTPLGRGVGDIQNWRDKALVALEGTAAEGELDDTAASPSKDMILDKVPPNESAAKRRLVLDGKQDMETDDMEHAGNELPVGLATPENTNLGHTEIVDANDRKKRTKKDGANSSSIGSAASLEETVWSQ